MREGKDGFKMPRIYKFQALQRPKSIGYFTSEVGKVTRVTNKKPPCLMVPLGLGFLSLLKNRDDNDETTGKLETVTDMSFFLSHLIFVITEGE
ncbi:hypothetical protein GBA52_023657 [Prunus armeniaca]|nr:hypothetical protein GBA52_023657 [Prunus armeniaca]